MRWAQKGHRNAKGRQTLYVEWKYLEIEQGSPEKDGVSDWATFLLIVLMVSHHLENKMQFCAQHTIITPPTWLAQSMAIFFFFHLTLWQRWNTCTSYNIFLIIVLKPNIIFIWDTILPTYYHQHKLTCNIFSKTFPAISRLV